MIIAVHQPQYMPWLGYFDKIAAADHFVLLDTVQFKKNEWQNRNQIKTAQGKQWFTVPVTYHFPEKIHQVRINNAVGWQENQQKSLQANYAKAPFFNNSLGFLDRVFADSWETISELNCFVVKELVRALGISTPIYIASELGDFPDSPDERLIGITKHFCGTIYLAGSGGRQYMDLDKFRRAGIEVLFQEYHHPVYPQLFGDFEPYMSVLDLLFNCGPASLNILRGNE